MNDVWVWTPATSTPGDVKGSWRQADVAHAPKPSPRRAHSAVVWRGSHVVVFGGKEGKSMQPLADTWVLTAATAAQGQEWTWEAIPSAAFPGKPRKGHSAVLVGADQMVVFGGRVNEVEYLNDAVVLAMDGKDTSTWKWRTVKLADGSPQPSKRNHHIAAAASRSRMVVYGGRAGHDAQRFPPLTDAWMLDLDASKWTRLELVADSSLPAFLGTPIPRIEAAVARTKSGVVMFGGQDVHGSKLNDAWVLDLSDPSKPSWRAVSPLDCSRVGWSALAPATELSFGFALATFVVLLLFLRWRSRVFHRAGYEQL